MQYIVLKYKKVGIMEVCHDTNQSYFGFFLTFRMQ
jgi:hypothetical protein